MRMPHSLQSRLLLTFVTLMVLGLGGVTGLSGWQLTAQTLDRNKHDLELQAQIIANGLRDPIGSHESGDHSGAGRPLEALIGSFGEGDNRRVTFVDAQLNVVYSSDSAVTPGVQDTHGELIAARDGTPQSEIRWDEWGNEERLFVAVPVGGDRGQPFGYVQVSIPTAPIYAEMWQTWLTFIVIGGAMLLVTVAASTLVARQIAVPVQKLTSTSEQIAAGRLDERVAPAGPNEIRRLGVAFNLMAERVQEMIAQQRAFVDNAAHELRSPLTSLRLRIEMLQTRGMNDVELTQRYLRQMEREVGYLQRMVDHLLALASIENAERVVPKKPLDLARILYAVADGMSPNIRQAGLRIQTDIPEHLPMLEANAEQMVALVRNLIENAIKYSRAGGTITLDAQGTADEIVIRVADTGVGITAEALPHIFERFYRADTSHTRDSAPQSGGVGLGLSLVHSIVQAYGGRIDVQSQVNQGSTFTIHLPLFVEPTEMTN